MIEHLNNYMRKFRTWLPIVIIIVAVLGIVLAIKFLPIWATLLAVGSAAFGGFCSWYGKRFFIKENSTPNVPLGCE